MNVINVPNFFHDVFGESISPLEIILILGFGIGASILLFSQHPAEWTNLAYWKTALLFILILDIAAGCVANFTRSTSNFYAARAKNRIVFIALHIQPIIIALLLSSAILPTFLIWAYTTASAFLVNALQNNLMQTFTGGLLLCLGIIGLTQLFTLNSFSGIVLLLFMIKVIYSFAVNHYAFQPA